MASSTDRTNPESASEQLDQQEMAAVEKIKEIPMGFKIWSQGRREDSDGTKTLPVEQPARILENVSLFIGDIDDALDVEKLKKLNIKAVVNLCSERISRKSYWSLPGNLAEAQIDQLVLCADDSWDFDIIPVAERAYGFISSVLKQGNGVLVHCYGGVNRSGAVCAAYLTSELSIPLYEAVERLRKVRGTVLTNETFVKQLVQHFSQKKAKLM
jgi:hypothetical protein